jgi:quinol monooxygenase YgiN
MMSEKIRPHHLQRKAILYVRQSSAHQVLHNRESSALQYAMRDRLTALGWSRIETVDDDLGRSAAGGNQLIHGRRIAVWPRSAGARFARDMMTAPSRWFVVIAEFTVKPGAMPAFLALAHDDARLSVAHEPGCLAFDVAVAQDDPGAVVFYEVYDDRAAFDAHLQTPHLARFRAGFPALIVAERAVRFLERTCSGTEPA